MGGVVSYSDAAKHDILGVPDDDLESYGAVSEEVARAMARGARAKLRADVAVAITGVAGPGGGTPTKPVGLVWFALDSARLAEPQTVKVEWSNTSREAVRARATALALNLLRLELLRP
jgi:PncC family amidohydrolase